MFPLKPINTAASLWLVIQMCGKQVLPGSVNHQAISAVSDWRERKYAHPVGMRLKSEAGQFPFKGGPAGVASAQADKVFDLPVKSERDLNTAMTASSPPRSPLGSS